VHTYAIAAPAYTDEMPYAVSADDFAELVEQALAEVPPEFEEMLEDISVEVLPEPMPRQRRAVGTRRGALLLGLYQGRPLTRRSVMDSGALPDVIHIFQNNLQQISSSREDLIRQIRTTVLHEIGHHFGLSEEDLKKLGYG
jgi:predicted Zn-dependent protease with MMP-like domain